MVPFTEPQPERIYKKIRRSNNPIKEAHDLGVLDMRKLSDITQKVKKVR